MNFNGIYIIKKLQPYFLIENNLVVTNLLKKLNEFNFNTNLLCKHFKELFELYEKLLYRPLRAKTNQVHFGCLEIWAKLKYEPSPKPG